MKDKKRMDTNQAVAGVDKRHPPLRNARELDVQPQVIAVLPLE